MPRVELYPGCTLHRIAPYLGRMPAAQARRLVACYSKEGDTVWDPFCGSGTIPLECALLGRHVIAGDINPYALAITRAKLIAPRDPSIAASQIDAAEAYLASNRRGLNGQAPLWVRSFFHQKTLIETIALFERFKRRQQHFLIGCLLGILQHHRPGFLSRPASSFTPYVRDRLFPRSEYPEMYSYRDPIPRLRKKVERLLFLPPPDTNCAFSVGIRSATKRYIQDDTVDAVITSPPYMNILDYARDNRLRLWFLGCHDFKVVKRREIANRNDYQSRMALALQNIAAAIRKGGHCVLVLGVLDGWHDKKYLPDILLNIVRTKAPCLELESRWTERPTSKPESRTRGQAMKAEEILIFRRS